MRNAPKKLLLSSMSTAVALVTVTNRRSPPLSGNSPPWWAECSEKWEPRDQQEVRLVFISRMGTG